MEMDFGYGSAKTADDAVQNNDGTNNNGAGEDIVNISTGGIESSNIAAPAEDITVKNNEPDANATPADSNKPKEGDENNTGNDLVAGTSIEIGDETYTVDDNGNLVDKDGKIFKAANEVSDYLKQFDTIENPEDEDITIDSIQEAIGVEILDDKDKPIKFENTVEGIKSYVDAVIETAKDEHYETAINTLYQKYPILNDVLNYYIANGNSLEGFGEMPDRSNITVNDSDEAQQEAIIKTAWKEQNRKGDVDGYIQYLKSSGLLLATAQEELAGLQEADKQRREELAEEAERKENERIETLQKYWEGVHDTIKNREIAGYKIPESIVISRNGQKVSATPEDFFAYLYRVDQEGYSAYERDLAKETPESRRDDEILRAYLKFVGGNYSNLVDMAINKEKVAKLRFKAKERKTSVRITTPTNTNKKQGIDLGYN